MQRIHHDSHFQYQLVGKSPGTCDLEVYSNEDRTIGVVVWTELADNPSFEASPTPPSNWPCMCTARSGSGCRTPGNCTSSNATTTAVTTVQGP